MNKLVIGVNTAMFDGLETDVAFSTIKKAGFRYVELAYNQGYVGDMPRRFLARRMPDIFVSCWRSTSYALIRWERP